MHPFNWLSRLFHHTTDMELEEKYTEELIKENEQALEDAYNSDEIQATVIYYIAPQDDNVGPQINVLCDVFHGKMLPEVGSIIWVTLDGALRPFKCIRYDFIENNSEYDSLRVYIVVEPATISDIIPNPKFNI